MLQRRRGKRQRKLFEEDPVVRAQVQLPLSVHEQLREVLVQWIQTLAKMIQEGGNE